MNSIANGTNSLANMMKSIAKRMNSIAKTCTMLCDDQLKLFKLGQAAIF